MLLLALLLAASSPSKHEWLGPEMPLPLAVRTPQDLEFKSAAEKQYLIFNLLAGGKLEWLDRPEDGRREQRGPATAPRQLSRESVALLTEPAVGRFCGRPVGFVEGANPVARRSESRVRAV